MVRSFHIPAQYLTTVAKSFLQAKRDDSHTNLGWINQSLCTHALDGNNLTLCLDYSLYALVWTNDLGINESLELDQKTHAEIVDWIHKTSNELIPKGSYEYSLHFDLPYTSLSNEYTFHKPSAEVINEHVQRRDAVHKALEMVLENHLAPVRVWPHHFDTAMLVEEIVYKTTCQFRETEINWVDAEAILPSLRVGDLLEPFACIFRKARCNKDLRPAS